MTKIKNIAILTSGGDAPGMNAAIRAVAKKAKSIGIKPFLIQNGYEGLVNNDIIECDFKRIDQAIVRGGTFIFSARFPQFAEKKYQKIAVENLKKLDIQAIVVIGGDGSYRGAQALSRHGVRTIALPGTIDNDITSSDYTIGFFTALNRIMESCESINDTAHSHHRIIIVEVMGHGCGDLAAYAGAALSPILISTLESKRTNAEFVNAVLEAKKKKSKSNIIIVSEEVHDLNRLLKLIAEKANVTTRAVVLGHVQRGGAPSALDRYIATMMGVTAVEKLLEGVTSSCIGWIRGEFVAIDIEEALKMPRKQTKKIVDEINNLNKLMYN